MQEASMKPTHSRNLIHLIYESLQTQTMYKDIKD